MLQDLLLANPRQDGHPQKYKGPNPGKNNEDARMPGDLWFEDGSAGVRFGVVNGQRRKSLIAIEGFFCS